MTVQQRRVLIDQFGPPMRMQVVEGEDGGKLVVEGKIGHCDQPTANNRVYPRTVMEREVARLQPRIKQGSVLGAVDHPGDGKSRVREAGCIMRGLWIEDTGAIHGKFEVVEEADAGRNLAAFMRRGAAIGMSSRGMGSTSSGPKGWDVVGEDFKLNTWDFVADPACHDAYPAVFTEDMDGEGKATGKIVIDPDQVTEGALRTKFPDAVRAIEEHALKVAAETVAAEEAENRDDLRAKLREEIAKELEEDFAVKLVRSLAEMRTTVEEEVRSDFASDPATAGAKMALSKIAEMVSPFQPDPTGQKILDEKDVQIGELAKAVEEQEAAKKAETARVAKLEQKGRELAFRLYVADALAGHPQHEQVRGLIGDVAECKDAGELRSRVESALAAVVQAQTQAEEEAGRQTALMEERALVAEQQAEAAAERERRFQSEITGRLDEMQGRFEEALGQRDAQLSKARAQLAEREGQLQEALNTGGKAALMAYASDRLVGHPKRNQIMEAVGDGRIRSQRGVDHNASKFEVRAQTPGGPLERVRRAMSGGREHLREDERVRYERQVSEETEVDHQANGEAAHDLSFLGTSLTEQRKLAHAVRNGRSRR
jgi:hypothetical protein